LKQKSVLFLIFNLSFALMAVFPFAAAQTGNDNPVLVAFPSLSFSQPTAIANDGTQQLSTANEQISSSVQQVAGASHELTKIAATMQNNLAKFIV